MRREYESGRGIRGWFVWNVLEMRPGSTDIGQPQSIRRWLAGILLASYRRGTWHAWPPRHGAEPY